MTINEVLNIEKSISEMVEKIKTDIIQEIKTPVNPDYKPINSLCVVVRFSALAKGENLAPEYYIPDIQARFVESVLCSVQTAHSLQNKLKELIEKSQLNIKIVCRS